MIQQAEDLRRQGRLDAAFDRYSELLSERLRVGGDLSAADILIAERTVELAGLLGHPAADPLLAGIIGLYRRENLTYQGDYFTIKRIELALASGDLRGAYDLLLGMQATIGDVRALRFDDLAGWEAARRWSKNDAAARAVLFTRLYLVMGRLLASLGQYRDALAALDRGIVYAAPNAPELAQAALVPLQLTRAGALLEMGDFAAAESALGALESDEHDQPAVAIYLRELQGKLYLLRGEFEAALGAFRAIIERCQGAGLRRAEARARFNLAHVLILLNQTVAASTMLDQAEALANALRDPLASGRAQLLRQLAYARGHTLAATPSVSALWKTLPANPCSSGSAGTMPRFDLRQSENFLAFFDDRALGFHWMLGRGDLAGAARHLAEMQGVFASTDSRLILLRLRVLAGILAYYRDEITQSASILEAARPELRALDLRPEVWQTGRFVGWCWARLGRPDDEQRALTAEIDALLVAMTDSLDAGDRPIFLLNKWTADEEALAALIAELRLLQAEYQAARWYERPLKRLRIWRALNRLIDRIERYQDERVKADEDTAGAPPRATPLWARLLRQPFDRATINFLVLPDQTLIVRRGWLLLDFAVSPVTRLQLREDVRRWHELAAHLPGGGRGLYLIENLPPTAEDAFGRVRRAIEGELALDAVINNLPRRVRRLNLIPDDVLHGVPFAALAPSDVPLIERFALSSGFAPPAPVQARERSALLVGVAQPVGGFEPLPGTLPELASLRDWLAQRDIPYQQIIDGDARRSAVIDGLARAALIHIACHGVFQTDHPEQSGFVLPGADGQPEILSLRDLAALRLDGVQHVTLSSCWSADSFVLPGRWIISLPQTLTRAGAQSALGCLWLVHDRVASAFTARFYEYLATQRRDDALRLTQLDCLKRALPGCADIDTRPAFYWAGYRLYGDPSRLRV